MRSFRYFSAAIILVSAFGCRSTDSSEGKAVEDISSMQRVGDSYHIICNDGETQRIPVRQFRDTDPDDICPRGNNDDNDNGGGRPDHRDTTLYGDSQCSQNQFVGTVSPRSSCTNLPNTYVYSIKRGNECQALPQGLRQTQACEAFKASARGVRLHNSSNCSGNSILASVDGTSECSTIASNAPNYYVAAIQTRNACIGLPQQLRIAQACESFKSYSEENRDLYSDSNCGNNSLIASVNEESNCEQVAQNSPNYYVAGVKIEGQCHQLPQQMRITAACNLFKTPGDVSLHNDSNCNNGSLLAMVDDDTSCEAVQPHVPNYYVSGVKVGDRCEQLPQQLRFTAACSLFKESRHRITLHNDSQCNNGSLLAPVSENVDCNALQQNAPNYYTSAIRFADGTCRGLVQQLRISAACTIAKGATRRSTYLFSDQSCGQSSLIATVGRQTDCSVLGQTAPNYYVAGVLINGQCQGLAQQIRVAQACEQFRDR